MILNVISPLLPSCWAFSFAPGHGVSFFHGVRHSPVDGCAVACWNFGVLAGENEHTSFSSAILPEESAIFAKQTSSGNQFLGTLSLSLSLSLILAFLGKCCFRSLLWSLAKEEISHLYLAFTNNFYWVCIAAPHPQPSGSLPKHLKKSLQCSTLTRKLPASPHQPPLICPLRKREQNSGVRHTLVQTELGGAP